MVTKGWKDKRMRLWQKKLVSLFSLIESVSSGIHRISSRDQLDKVRRKITKALTVNEPRSLPAVQRAKPNQVSC